MGVRYMLKGLFSLAVGVAFGTQTTPIKHDWLRSSWPDHYPEIKKDVRILSPLTATLLAIIWMSVGYAYMARLALWVLLLLLRLAASALVQAAHKSLQLLLGMLQRSSRTLVQAYHTVLWGCTREEALVAQRNEVKALSQHKVRAKVRVQLPLSEEEKVKAPLEKQGTAKAQPSEEGTAAGNLIEAWRGEAVPSMNKAEAETAAWPAIKLAAAAPQDKKILKLAVLKRLPGRHTLSCLRPCTKLLEPKHMRRCKFQKKD